MSSKHDQYRVQSILCVCMSCSHEKTTLVYLLSVHHNVYHYAFWAQIHMNYYFWVKKNSRLKWEDEQQTWSISRTIHLMCMYELQPRKNYTSIPYFSPSDHLSLRFLTSQQKFALCVDKKIASWKEQISNKHDQYHVQSILCVCMSCSHEKTTLVYLISVHQTIYHYVFWPVNKNLHSVSIRK